jgi:hypothetical protein
VEQHRREIQQLINEAEEAANQILGSSEQYQKEFLRPAATLIVGLAAASDKLDDLSKSEQLLLSVAAKEGKEA